MYNKTIIRFDFCDIQNNQGLGTGEKWMRAERTPKEQSAICPAKLWKTAFCPVW